MTKFIIAASVVIGMVLLSVALFHTSPTPTKHLPVQFARISCSFLAEDNQTRTSVGFNGVLIEVNEKAIRLYNDGVVYSLSRSECAIQYQYTMQLAN